MRIIMKESYDIEFCDICIEYHHLNFKRAKEIQELIGMYNDNYVINEENYSVYQFHLDKIFYIECKDHKIYSYYQYEKRVIKTKNPNEFKNKIVKYGFIKINKSIYMNMNYVQSFSVIEGSKRKVVLVNNKELIVSRKYKNLFDNFYKLRQ